MRVLAIALIPSRAEQDEKSEKSEKKKKGAQGEGAACDEKTRISLERIAEAALAFGALTSFEASSSGDTIWVDVTGCARVFGDTEAIGERKMAERARDLVTAMGHGCKIAIANGMKTSRAIARFAESQLSIVEKGVERRALSELPVRALGLDDDDRSWLEKLGMRTVGDVMLLPRGPLGARLEKGREVLALLEGDDRAPLEPYVPAEIPEEIVELDHGVTSTEALTFVAKTLASRMSARLLGRAMKATKMDVVLTLDRAATGARGPRREARTLPFVLPSPLGDEKELFVVLRAKIEALSHERLAPVLGMSLRVTEMTPRSGKALSLFEPEAKAERALPELVATLSAELGENAVGTLALGDAWLAESRTELIPFGKKRPKAIAAPLVTSVPEPARVLAEPLAVDASSVKVVRHLSRVDATFWWTGARITRDYVIAETPEGFAMVEIDRKTGSKRVRGWMD